MNKTDQRIITLWNKGLSIKRIAERIGRPSNFERIYDAFERAGMDKNDYELENNRRMIKEPKDGII